MEMENDLFQLEPKVPFSQSRKSKRLKERKRNEQDSKPVAGLDLKLDQKQQQGPEETRIIGRLGQQVKTISSR